MKLLRVLPSSRCDKENHMESVAASGRVASIPTSVMSVILTLMKTLSAYRLQSSDV